MSQSPCLRTGPGAGPVSPRSHTSRVLPDALVRSIDRVRRARRAAVLTLLSLPLAAAHAQSTASAPMQTSRLDAVVVTATREPAALAEVVADVVVIDAEQIRASGADSLEDLLRRLAGAQLSRNGGPGQSAGVLLRGSGANGSVVLVDGVRLVSATLGQAALESISLAHVERIEVLRGPASSLYGADAIGGVVRITTRRGASGDAAPSLQATARVGSLKSREFAASIGAGGPVDWSLGLARESSQGISAVAPGDRFGQHNPDRDGFTRTSAQAALGAELAAGHRVSASLLAARLNARYDAAEFAPPTFVPDPSPDFRNRLDNRVLALDYRGRITSLWTTTLAAGTQRDELRSGGTTVDRFVTDREQFTWQNALALASDQQLVLALDHVREAVQSSSFAVPAPQRRSTGAVASWTGRVDAVRWQADLRRDRSTPGDDASTGKLGAAVELGEGWSVRGAAGTAFRAPSFNELYFPDFGVASLRPERARSLEFGLDWAGPADADRVAPRLGLTAFRNRVRDLITVASGAPACPPPLSFCAANVGRATLRGVGLDLAQPLWRADGASIDLRARLDWLDAEDADTGTRLPRRAPHQQSISVTGREGPWGVAVGLLAVAARSEGGQTLGAYQTVDFKFTRRLAPGWQAEVSVLNAFDRRYEVALDYPGLPRQTWIGLRYDGRP